MWKMEKPKKKLYNFRNDVVEQSLKTEDKVSKWKPTIDVILIALTFIMWSILMFLMGYVSWWYLL